MKIKLPPMKVVWNGREEREWFDYMEELGEARKDGE